MSKIIGPLVFEGKLSKPWTWARWRMKGTYHMISGGGITTWGYHASAKAQYEKQENLVMGYPVNAVMPSLLACTAWTGCLTTVLIVVRSVIIPTTANGFVLGLSVE